MAVINVNFISKSLLRNVDVKVILPIDKFSLADEVEWDKKPFKTLYLLHGVFDDCNSWLNNTRILRWASEKDLAVVMPSGENLFYYDQRGEGEEKSKINVGTDYGKFIGEELVEMTRNMFPLSKKRDDTFIAGLSMGGYGALINGCKYHKTFSRVGALSPALVIDDAIKSTYNKSIILRNRAFFEHYLGNLDNVKESDRNPFYLIERLHKENVELPSIYLACGKSDHLFPRVEELATFLMSQNTDFIFEKSPGNHDWDFWDEHIKKVIDWLPL